MKLLFRSALIAWSCFGIFAFPFSRDVQAAQAAPSPAVHARCDWSHPGVNPFMGGLPEALDHYADIPPAVRARLQARMQSRDYDDLVSIRRDGMVGRGGYEYGSEIRDMHFGTGQVCRQVSRSSWTPDMQERGLVYCDSGECILVPTVCRNVSRISRQGVGAAVGGAPLLAAAPVADELPPIDWFGPAGAGLPADPGLLASGGELGHADAPGGVSFASGMGASPAMVLGSVGGIAAGVAGGMGPAVGPVAQAAALASTAGDATVAAVPEPGTWCLMLGGLFLVCRAASRRAARS